MEPNLTTNFYVEKKNDNNIFNVSLQYVSAYDSVSTATGVPIYGFNDGKVIMNLYFNPRKNKDEKICLKNLSIYDLKLIFYKERFIIFSYENEKVYHKMIGSPIYYNDDNIDELLKPNNKNRDSFNNYNKMNNFTKILNLSYHDTNPTIRATIYNKNIFPTKKDKNKKIIKYSMGDESTNAEMIVFSDLFDKYNNYILVGKTYVIENFKLSKVNQEYLKDGYPNFNIILNETSRITAIDYENFTKKHNFRKISELEKLNINTIFDLICIIENMEEREIVKKNDGETVKIIKLIVVDDSNTKINLEIWENNFYKLKSPKINDIILIENCILKEYNGYKLINVVNDTIFSTNINKSQRYSNIMEYYNNIYKNNKENINYKLLSADSSKIRRINYVKFFVDSTLEISGNNAKLDNIIAYIKYIKNPIYYDSCSNDGCLKKVIKNEYTNNYECQKCNTMIEFPKKRYNLFLKISDESGSLWTTCLNEDATKTIIGYDPDEYYSHTKTDPNLLSKIIKSIKMKPYRFLIKAAESIYNTERTIKYTILRVETVDNNISKFYNEVKNILSELNIK